MSADLLDRDCLQPPEDDLIVPEFAANLARQRRSDAVAFSRSLRRPWSPPPAAPPRRALTFGVRCPECGGLVNVLSATTPAVRSTSTILQCAACAVTVRATVSLRICDARRYELAPLVDWILARNDTTNDDTGANCDMSFIANRLGIDRNTLHYYRRNGVSDATADRLATRLNVHPSQIWPTWWATTTTELVDA